MKKFFKCSILILTLLLLFSFKIVKAEGSVQLTPSDIVDEVVRLARDSEGDKKSAHSCLSYVNQIWIDAASPYKKDILNYPSSLLYRLYNDDYKSSCAKCSYDSFKLPKDNTRTKYNIPNGASVYLKGGSYKCGSHHIAGHVGIYIQELNKIAHVWSGKVRLDSLEFFERNGYKYVDWYYHRGMTLKELEPTEENSKLKIDLIDFPSQIRAGNSCSIKGTVSSNFKLKVVQGMIYKNSSTCECSGKVSLSNTVCYKLDLASSKINSTLKFGDLKIGNYTLYIEAIDETDKLVSISKKFSIEAPDASTLKINLTSYPTKLSPGVSYGLRGSISSNYRINEVKGEIYKYISNEYKHVSQSTLDTPKSKYLNIASANLNNNLKFKKLTIGQYRLTITATDASGKTVKIDRYFRIVHINIDLSTIPSTVTYGKSFGLKGTITSSTAYKLNKVSGYITTLNGTVKFSSVDYPNSKTMNIQSANLNQKLSFRKLQPGPYLLKIKAQDTYGNTDEVTYHFTVKAK